MFASSHSVVAACGSLVEEMRGELGDQRLDARRDRVIAALEQCPDVGFPDACGDDAEVEALYRFLRNRRISHATVIEPHVVATRARCAAVGDVLVIHDTTDMVFTGLTARTGLAALGQGRHGFWVHAALAVSADGLRAPLGLLSLLPFVRRMQAPGTRKIDAERFRDPDKESRCWFDGLATVRQHVRHDGAVIHVMDRAADSYELFAAMIAHGDRFVVRLNHDRRIVTATGASRLSDARPGTHVLCEREVTLAARSAGNRPLQSRRKHPSRDSRSVTLRFGARHVVLQRPAGARYAHLPATLDVHVVYAWESAPPPGEEPVEWRLITTEPITTVDQVLGIVDWYRTRWMIEEFFKALKTGCAYEKRQLESLQTLLVALALLAPIAWQLLLLRHVARTVPDAPATAVLTARQVQVLRASPPGTGLPLGATLRDVLGAVARLGGHLKQNGDPGWLVLGRGMQKLLWMEKGWAAAEHARK